jgi:hypothetical protein
MQHLTTVILMTLVGCMPIPYPHKVVTHSTITGRVVDAESREPVANIGVSVRSDWQSHATTGDDGLFCLPPREHWRPFVIIPLLPWDFFPHEEIVLQQTVRVDHQHALHYRRGMIQVNSHPIPLFGWDRGRENLSIVDDLGDIPIMRMPVQIGR